MKKIKFLVPLIIALFTVALFAGQVVDVRKNNPNSIPRLTGIFGIDCGTAAANHGVMLDSVGALTDAIWAYDSVQLIGAKIYVTSGDAIGEMRYILQWRDTTVTTDITLGSLFVSPNWDTTAGGDYIAPDSGDTYVIFYTYDNASSAEKQEGKIRDLMGWPINYGDTVYSQSYRWNEGAYGNRYSFIYSCKMDTILSYTIGDTVTDSLDVRVWVETSPDNSNWGQPQGYTSIIANLTDYNLAQMPYDIPKGTYYYRYGITGNVGHQVHLGRQWLTQWIQMMGK